MMVDIVSSTIINFFCQIPLLLSIGEEDTALLKATECGDTDLVYLVLFHIWRKVCRLQCNLYLQIKGSTN